MKFSTDSHRPQKMNPIDFCDPLIFHLAATNEISQQLLDIQILQISKVPSRQILMMLVVPDF